MEKQTDILFTPCDRFFSLTLFDVSSCVGGSRQKCHLLNGTYTTSQDGGYSRNSQQGTCSRWYSRADHVMIWFHSLSRSGRPWCCRARQVLPCQLCQQMKSFCRGLERGATRVVAPLLTVDVSFRTWRQWRTCLLYSIQADDAIIWCHSLSRFGRARCRRAVQVLPVNSCHHVFAISGFAQKVVTICLCDQGHDFLEL